MVYYNPYKQIWRAFIRAVRTFISSLFSKRLLLMIIVALVIILLHINVHAESIHNDSYAYRDIKYLGYDSEIDSHKYSYRVYTIQGLKEGEFILPSTLYNNNVWFINFQNNGSLFYWTNTSNVNSATMYFNQNGSNLLSMSWNAGSKYLNNCNFYRYNFETNVWSVEGSITGNSQMNFRINNSDSVVDPASILVTHNCNIIYYRDSTHFHSFTEMQDLRVLKVSELKYLVGSGFRLYLNDFIPYNSADDEDWDKNYELSDSLSVYMYVYDRNSQTYKAERQQLYGIDIDDDNNYFIDLYFDELFPYMNLLDGDYLLFFNLILESHKRLNDMPELYNSCIYWVTTDYYRYVYYANSGVGILRTVDENGEPINEDEPSDEEYLSVSAINAVGDKIEEQTQVINEMSDFLQDDSFSSDSITNNMPSSDEFQDITESGFDNIFTTLRNAFTSDNYQDVEFEVPFSNGQKITIPSNLTENIIPTAIKTLIQMVYWYFIARFIVKDIASYIEKAKSGDIFSSSDTNIKTDML